MYALMRSHQAIRAVGQAHALRLLVLSALVLSFTLAAPPQRAAAAGAANDHTVLILGSTVSGGTSSIEATAATAVGMTVEVVNAAGWAAKSTAEFASYRALILGDPTCGSLSSVAAAQANTAVWGPAVNGRVIIMGSDPVYHSGSGGGAFTTGAVQFVAGESAKTGAYVTLSCYYHGTAAHTPVPLLDAFSVGGFTARGVGCFNDAHIVASSPALGGSTDTTLSNWSCSVHEAFDAWPAASFDVLAIARGIGATFTASDGSTGTPYILARGVSVISDITLSPASGTAAPGTPYTLTATVQQGGTPTAGRTVTFRAIGGPNNGLTLTGAGPTNASGQTTATYTSAVLGTDTWVASFVDSSERTQTSGRATIDWSATAAPPVPTIAPRLAVLTASSSACGQIGASATGLTAGLPYQLVAAPAAGGTPLTVDVTASSSGSASATFDLKGAGGSYSVYVQLSIGIKYSKVATVSVVACPAPPAVVVPPVVTPVPPVVVPATPAPGLVPSTAASPSPSAPPAQAVVGIGRLPSTSTADTGTDIGLLLGLLLIGALAWRLRVRRI